jgi:hypothetical protein
MATQTISIDEYIPHRLPVLETVVMSTTAVDLGATITEPSHIPWELTCTAAWFVGTSSDQLRPVAANQPYNVPSSHLSGWYVKAAAATPTLVIMGARKVTT